MRTALIALSLIAPAAAAQTTLPLSVAPGGAMGDGGSSNVRGSPDLRWVAWHTTASNLVAGDSNGHQDVYLRDTWTAQTTRVSLAASGAEGDGHCRWPTVSADGGRVAFQSFATNLVPGDANGQPDIYVRDLASGELIRATVGLGGAEPDGPSRYPMVSRDGEQVVFESHATNLVPGDTNGVKDVFLCELATGAITRLSRGPGGVGGDGDSGAPTFSPDQSKVTFVSLASNLAAGDANGAQDVFVRDLATGAVACASTDSGGAFGDASSHDPYLSGDGRWVSFRSEASNLVPGDTNGVGDVFVKDLQLGTILRASVGVTGGQASTPSYAPWVTPEGRYVLFTCDDPTLVAGDTNDAADVFLRDLVAGTLERVNLGWGGQQADGGASYPVPSDDARLFVFDSVATNLVAGDANGLRDAFLRDHRSSFQPFCGGEASLAVPCPCGNAGAAGHGCASSGGAAGALLAAGGTTAPDTVVLTASGEPASALTIFLQGDAASAAGLPFGDGVRCVAGTLLRLYVAGASDGAVSVPPPGGPSVTQAAAGLGAPIAPGALRWYQAYYRDPDPGFCSPATFNATNAVRIAW